MEMICADIGISPQRPRSLAHHVIYFRPIAIRGRSITIFFLKNLRSELDGGQGARQGDRSRPGVAQSVGEAPQVREGYAGEGLFEVV